MCLRYNGRKDFSCESICFRHTSANRPTGSQPAANVAPKRRLVPDSFLTAEKKDKTAMATASVLAAPPSPATCTDPTSTGTPLLDQLESFIKGLVSPAPTQALDLGRLGAQVPGLQPLLHRLPGDCTHITGLQLVPAPGSLTLTGTLMVCAVPFHVTAVCTVAGSGVQLVLTGTQDEAPLTLLALLSHLGHDAPHTPDVSLTGLSLTLGTDKGDFALNGTANWPIPFANTPSLTVAASVALTSTTATITGTFLLDTQTFNVTCNLAKNANSLEAIWTNHSFGLTWDSVLTAAGIPTKDHVLPAGFAGPKFTHLELLLDFSDRSLTFAAETDAGVDACLVVQRAASGWGFLLGVHQGKGPFQFESISKDLAVFDILGVEKAYLVAATHDVDSFVFPSDSSATNCPPPVDAIPLKTGLNLGAQLTFPDGPDEAHVLHKLFGELPALSLSGSLNLPAHVTLTASMGQSLLIPKSSVQLLAPTISIGLNGPKFSAAVRTGIIVPLGGGQTPLTLNGSLSIDTTQAEFTGNAAADFTVNAPFGLHGLVLQDVGGSIGIAFDPDPGFSVGLEVGFALGGVLQPGETLAFDFDISPETLSVEPVYLYAKVSQPITLPLLVQTVAPSLDKLPDLFNDFSLNNLLLSYAQPPSQTLPDGTVLTGGYQFSASLQVFHFDMQAALNVTLPGGPGGTAGAAGVSGAFAMDPITWPGFSLTGVTTPGLSFSFSTAALSASAAGRAAVSKMFGVAPSNLPMVTAQGKVELLGAANAQVVFQLDADGLLFGLSVNASGNTLLLSCTVYQSTFSASCHVTFQLNAGFDLYVPVTNQYVGKLNVNANFDGGLTLLATTSGATLTLHGTFDGYTLPGGTFSASTDALKDLGSTVINRIRDQAEEVFKDVTGDSTKWAKLFKGGLITGADSVANDASNAFGQAVKGLSGTGSTLRNTGENALGKIGSVLGPL